MKSLISGAITAVLMGAAVAAVIFLYPSKPPQCEPGDAAEAAGKHLTKSFENVVFINLDPLVISLGPNAKAEYLKISVSLETSPNEAVEAEHLKPRFRDVLNAYLRAVDENDLIEPAAMTRLRAQMLRRLQVASSPEIVSDLLITDFVLN